jgi:hypothetical protein
MAEEPKDKDKIQDEAETAAEDNPKKTDDSAKSDSRWRRLLAWYKRDKRKSIPLTIVVLLLVLAAVPWSRYHTAGLVLKKDFVLQVNDASTKTPVSGANVTLGLVSGTTDANGKVTLRHVSVGEYTAIISKKFYKESKVKVVVPILSQKSTPQIDFVATGRQIKIVVTNLISGDKLEGVEIKLSETSSKTDKKGTATIVVPAGATSAKAKLSAKGYNDADVTLSVSDKEIKENSLKLTPAGKVYFLSKLSGKIDVVKTNLDGTERQTVLPGTGFEDNRGTVLLASRDWKYLALLSKRDGGNPRLYLINTSDDGLTMMDQGNVTFNLAGWNDDNFIYTATRNDLQLWQPNRQSLKSYNAATKQVTLLDQTKGEGTYYYDYLSEEYGKVYQVGKNIIYNKIWNSGGGADASQKAHAIYSIAANGSNSQTLKTFPLSSYNFLESVPYEASEIYFRAYSNDYANKSYFIYQSGKVNTAGNDISKGFDEYAQNPLSYLLSPSGNNTFWAESRDGKYTLFVGDQDGEAGKQIATLSEYLNYGWFSDDYLLVSKKSSELYVLPKNGVKKDSDAVKISDYHKPAQSFYGYGGGYGGI